VRGFSTFKGKVQAIREDIDSFEKRVVKALADIQCVLEVIRPYDLAQEGIVAPYKVLLLFRCEFQQGEEVSRKVKEALLQHRNTHIDSISRELYKGLGTPDWGTRSRSQTVESLKSEVVKHEKELAAQRSTLEAQQSTTQRLLQGMEELRHTLEKEDSPRRREKVESLKSEVDNHEKELATQRSTLEAQQSTTQRVLQGMEELRHSLEKGDSQIQSCRSAS
jgi:chromosome segregation ATPase